VMVGNPVLGVMIAREDKTPQAVWKFQLGHHDTRTEVEMPRGAKIVEVAMQGDRFTLWAVVAPSEPRQTRVFYIVGTGHPIPPEAHTHLGTVHVDVFVFHVFEGFQ
jgi:hypothetical protein